MSCTPPPGILFCRIEIADSSPCGRGINLRARRTTGFEIALNIARHDQLPEYGPVPGTIAEGAHLLGHFARQVRVLEV